MRRFNTKRVNLSDEAFSYGGPDQLGSGVGARSKHVSNSHRRRRSCAASGSGSSRNRCDFRAQAAVAAKRLFYDMHYVDEAWCPLLHCRCLTYFTTFGFTLPEAVEAPGILRDRV